MKKIIVTILFLCIIVTPVKGLELAKNAKSSILLETTTGEILYKNNDHEKLPPASMTKMMSMLIIMESIDNGILKWDDIVTVSENASSMGGSQILLETGEQMSVFDLFKGVAVASGNDAVVALAETVAGTEDAFVELMNNRVKELGLKDTHFKNPHGLDEADHYSSAYDMAMIAKELLKHEKVLEFTSIYDDYLRKDTDRAIWLVNTNKLVRFYPGVDGLKTGYTEGSGYCLTATANKNNMRIVAVAMGEKDSKTRNQEVSEMLDYAFAQYSLDTIYTKDDVVDNIRINNSTVDFIDLVTTDNITFLRKKSEKKKEYTYDIKLDKIKLPIKHGDSVGLIAIKDGNEIIKTVPITVKEDLTKANIFLLFYNNIKDILSFNIY